MESSASILLQQPYHFHYEVHISIFDAHKCDRYIKNTSAQ